MDLTSISVIYENTYQAVDIGAIFNVDICPKFNERLVNKRIRKEKHVLNVVLAVKALKLTLVYTKATKPLSFLMHD